MEFSIQLVALLSLSSWCLVIVKWLFLGVPRVCLQFVIVVVPFTRNYNLCPLMLYTRSDQKAHGKVLLNRIAFTDCNENS